MNSTVSVIIPTYNYGHFLGDAIESVLNQTYPITEIIVVDDGSNDITEEVVKKFGEKVNYIKQNNGGLSKARNTGLENSTGDFIAFLDADDMWLPQKIEKEIAKFQEDDQFGLVFCGMREFDTVTNETIHLHLNGEEGWIAKELLLLEKPAVIGIGSTGLISRETLENVGSFDTDLKHSEDWDFSYRVAKKYKIGFVREVLVNYRNHGNNMHKNLKNLESAVQICFKKAFQTNDQNVLALRRKTYGNFHTELSGLYFRAGDYVQFFEHMVKALWLTPTNYNRYIMFPLNWLKRKRQLKHYNIKN
jgi:glycosyltransferase involved in cell wall biosynthesis